MYVRNIHTYYYDLFNELKRLGVVGTDPLLILLSYMEFCNNRWNIIYKKIFRNLVRDHVSFTTYIIGNNDDYMFNFLDGFCTIDERQTTKELVLYNFRVDDDTRNLLASRSLSRIPRTDVNGVVKMITSNAQNRETNYFSLVWKTTIIPE